MVAMTDSSLATQPYSPGSHRQGIPHLYSFCGDIAWLLWFRLFEDLPLIRQVYYQQMATIFSPRFSFSLSLTPPESGCGQRQSFQEQFPTAGTRQPLNEPVAGLFLQLSVFVSHDLATPQMTSQDDHLTLHTAQTLIYGVCIRPHNLVLLRIGQCHRGVRRTDISSKFKSSNLWGVYTTSQLSVTSHRSVP